ncbi:hypothetical protein HN680_08085, partial [Candidatus Peregrinibacteria bacterium]|nr:hypothetical protein [Candidatus Peregrinibacteria bacterium]
MADLKLKLEAGLVDKVSKPLRGIERQVDGFKKKLSTFAKVGLTALAAGVAAVGVSIIKTTGRFEQLEIAFTTMLGSGEKAR